jgi:hypothetical protein
LKIDRLGEKGVLVHVDDGRDGLGGLRHGSLFLTSGIRARRGQGTSPAPSI